MTAAEMRTMTAGALETELESRRRELLKMRCQLALGEDVHPHQVGALRHDIARLQTVLREKQPGAPAPTAGGQA